MLKIKGVAAVALFAILMAGACAYANHKTALAESEVKVVEPTCTVLFSPTPAEVAVGEVLKVTVLVDDVKNFYGFEIGLEFDPTIIEYVGSKTPQWRLIGGRLEAPKEWIFWAATATPQNGEVTLMEFEFKGIAKGSSSLSLFVHKLATSKYWEPPHDYVGWPIPHTVSEGIVTVE